MTGVNASPQGIRVRMRNKSETPALFEIERQASFRFANAGYESLAGTTSASLEDYEAFLADHEVFVAEFDEGDIAGFAAARDLQGLFWLQELSVLPSYGRMGIGTSLLQAVIDRARWSDYAVIGLSTFKSVPFNAAFYEKHGFLRIAAEELPTFVAEKAADDCPADIHPASRTVMLKRL